MRIDVEVEAEAWRQATPDVETVVRRTAQVVDGAPDGSSATVLLTDDAAVQDLNTRFRGVDRATNVLSFPSPKNLEGHLGDIALAYETCAREAAAQGKPLAAHLAHLTAHGLLHLLGFDHEDDADAEVMEDAERAALARLGLPDPYRAEASVDD